MKKLTLAIAGIAVAALLSGAALAQGRGGGGGHGGGSWGGGGGGSWSGGGGGGGSWNGGHGGSWNGGGTWHGGSGWHGNGWRGGCWGCTGWSGGWWGPAWWGGVTIGAPWWGWPGWGWGGWGAPAVSVNFPVGSAEPAVFAQDPFVFTERQPVQAPAPLPANQYWYYCTEPAGYFPYVQNCTRAWMQVVPQVNPGAPRVAPAQ